jgi:predicted AAA+ superfamily ATPase
MNLLEYYQNQYPFSEQYVTRKIQLPRKGDLNLYGVRGAGKTAMVLDLIGEEVTEQTLYIDLEDPNLIFHPLERVILQQFIDKHRITLLVLDHYHEDILPSFPNVERLIVVSRIALTDTIFTPIELFPLDYEEFLAFESSNIQSHSFNHFLRSGTLPLIARSQKNTAQVMKRFFQSSFDSHEQKLLLILAQHHTKHLTIHQIYTFAKEKFKVSKDWLYRTMKLFKQEKLVLFIDDRYQKSGKKMLLFDFAFAKYLTIGQPFIMQFDTMIALALMKHHIDVQTLGIHGYITKENELIIPAPFESEESLWVKSQNKFSLYKKYGIQKVTIVTVANSYTYTIEKLDFEALPFNEWSVINDEDQESISSLA